MVNLKDVTTRIIDVDHEQDIFEKLRKYIDSNPFSHFRQSVDWFSVSDKSKYCIAVSECRGQVVCSSIIKKRAFPFMSHKKYFIERGPLVSDPECLRIHLAQLVDLLRPRMLSLIVNPYYGGTAQHSISEYLLSLGFQACRIGGFYQRTIIVDLTKTADELYAEFSTKLRRHIQQSKTLGIGCAIVDSVEQRRLFYDTYEDFRSRNPGSGFLPVREIDEIYKRPSQKNCVMVLAEHQGNIVSGVLIFMAGQRAIYEYGFRSNYATNKGLPGIHLPLWNAIQHCQKMGASIFDMGGYVPEETEFSSINRFKRYFGRQEQTILGEYKYVPNTILAKMLDVIARIKYS